MIRYAGCQRGSNPSNESEHDRIDIDNIDEDGYQRLLVRSCHRMETVTYYGETDIETRAEGVICDVLH